MVIIDNNQRLTSGSLLLCVFLGLLVLSFYNFSEINAIAMRSFRQNEFPDGSPPDTADVAIASKRFLWSQPFQIFYQWKMYPGAPPVLPRRVHKESHGTRKKRRQQQVKADEASITARRNVSTDSRNASVQTVWDAHVCNNPHIMSQFQRDQWAKAYKALEQYDSAGVLHSYSPPDYDKGWDPRYLKFYLHPYYVSKVPIYRRKDILKSSDSDFEDVDEDEAVDDSAESSNSEMEDESSGQLRKLSAATFVATAAVDLWADSGSSGGSFGGSIFDNKKKKKRKKKDQKQSFKYLHFFSIYKSGNTFIRSLLQDYASANPQQQSTSRRCCTEINLHEWVNTHGLQINLVGGQDEGQYSFAFVRDPLARFISGFTEIEFRRRKRGVTEKSLDQIEEKKTQNRAYRIRRDDDSHSAQGRRILILQPLLNETQSLSLSATNRLRRANSTAMKGAIRGSTEHYNFSMQRTKRSTTRRSLLQLQHNNAFRRAKAVDQSYKRTHWEEKPLGSDERLETFILWLLRYNGSHSIIRECPECDHIAPQVGTLVAANVLRADLNVFKLEDFERSWQAMGAQAGIPRELMTSRPAKVRNMSRLLNHGSSEDQFNISSNALKYFGLKFVESVSSPASLVTRGIDSSVVRDSRDRSGSLSELYRGQAKRVVSVPTSTDSSLSSGTNSGGSGPDTANNNSMHMNPQNKNSPRNDGNKNDSSSSVRAVHTAITNTTTATTTVTPQNTTRQEAFLRAVCRIYLIDYVCLRYDLPTACIDMLEDVREFTKKIPEAVDRVDEQLRQAGAKTSEKPPVIYLKGYGWAEATGHNMIEDIREFTKKIPSAVARLSR